MNNCPKCGNPLQVGTTSCPICGTDIAAASAQPTKTTVTVASVATPTTPPVNVPAPVVEQPTSAPVVQAAPSTEPAPQAPVNVAPVTEAPTQPAIEAPVAAPAPAPETAAPVTVDPSSIAPTVQAIDGGTPVPSIPASLNPDANLSVSAPVEEPKKTKKAKKGINKNVLVILLVILVAGGIGAFFLMGGTGKKTTLTPAPVTEEVAYTSVYTNGYKLNIQEGWIIIEDGENIMITNSDETVTMRLDHSNFSVSSFTKETIESYFATRPEHVNPEILETTISAKEGYLVNTTLNGSPVQVYFIGGGSNLTIGASIVYVSEDSKTKYEAAVTEIIGSLSYSDESLKAISTIDMYNGALGVYSGIAAQTQLPQQTTPEEQPETEQPSTTPEEQQPVTEEQNTNTNPVETPVETPVTEQ